MPESLTIESPADKLIGQCKGQQIIVPDLLSLCPGWKPQLNQNPIENIEVQLQEWQYRSCSSPKLLEINRKTALIPLVQMAYPNADLQEALTAAKLMSWLFAYDDVLDYDDFKHMKVERKKYENDTISCMRQFLLDSNYCDESPSRNESPYLTVRAFHEIGCEISQSLQRRHLVEWICDSLCEYVTVSVKTLDYVDTGDIIDVNQYLDMRVHTSAAYPSLALCILTDHIDIPSWILELEVTRRLMKLVNIIISIDNDIFSVKKEVDLGHFDSLVPLLVHKSSYSAQSGIDEATVLIRESYFEFCRLEYELYDLVPAEHLDETRRLVQAWKNFGSGAANWHYAAKRYYGDSFKESQVTTTTL